MNSNPPTPIESLLEHVMCSLHTCLPALYGSKISTKPPLWTPGGSNNSLELKSHSTEDLCKKLKGVQIFIGGAGLAYFRGHIPWKRPSLIESKDLTLTLPNLSLSRPYKFLWVLESDFSRFSRIFQLFLADYAPAPQICTLEIASSCHENVLIALRRSEKTLKAYRVCSLINWTKWPLVLLVLLIKWN